MPRGEPKRTEDRVSATNRFPRRGAGRLARCAGRCRRASGHAHTAWRLHWGAHRATLARVSGAGGLRGETSPGDGLRLTGSDNIVSRVVVVRAGTDGVVVETGATGNEFIGNSVVRASGNGFHLREAGNRLSRNRASRSGGADLQDDTGAGLNDYGTTNRFRRSRFGDDGAPAAR